MNSLLLQSSVPKCSQNRIYHWKWYEHTALNNHRQAKCRLLFCVRHDWMDLHLISCAAQSLWTDLDFASAICRADDRTAWRLTSVKGVATHTVPRADSDTLSSQSAPWTLSVAYFSRQKSKQRVGDPVLTWKEATGTSFSCSSGSPAFREIDLPWSRTNCYPLQVAGMTTLEWGLGGQHGSFIPSSRVRTGQTAWIQDLHSQLWGHRKLIYMTASLFPDRTVLKISDNEAQFDWLKKRPLDQVSQDKKCWSGRSNHMNIYIYYWWCPWGPCQVSHLESAQLNQTEVSPLGEELIFQGLLDTDTQIIRNY